MNKEGSQAMKQATRRKAKRKDIREQKRQSIRYRQGLSKMARSPKWQGLSKVARVIGGAGGRWEVSGMIGIERMVTIASRVEDELQGMKGVVCASLPTFFSFEHMLIISSLVNRLLSRVNSVLTSRASRSRSYCLLD